MTWGGPWTQLPLELDDEETPELNVQDFVILPEETPEYHADAVKDWEPPAAPVQEKRQLRVNPLKNGPVACYFCATYQASGVLDGGQPICPLCIAQIIPDYLP